MVSTHLKNIFIKLDHLPFRFGVNIDTLDTSRFSLKPCPKINSHYSQSSKVLFQPNLLFQIFLSLQRSELSGGAKGWFRWLTKWEEPICHGKKPWKKFKRDSWKPSAKIFRYLKLPDWGGGIDRVSTSFLLAGLTLGHVMFISFFTFPRWLVVGHLNECHPPTIDFEQ